MRDAREDALEEAVPDGECSLKIVVPAAMQEYRRGAEEDAIFEDARLSWIPISRV